MPLKPSSHNIISPLKSGEEYLVVNLLSGHADILSPREAKWLTEPTDQEFPAEFAEKGYVAEPASEQLLYRLKYIEYLEEREKEEIQLFFVPTYSCNFSCSYCYQSDYPQQQQVLSEPITEAFFDYIHNELGSRKKYITLFGGEPLLFSPAYYRQIAYFIEKARQTGVEIAIVTNGYTLDKYLDILDKSFVREIQITLDGTQSFHDQRRRLKDNSPTFAQIVDNIDACLAKDIPVNLRMVADRDNLDNLPQLAGFAIDKGWTTHPLFKTQIGRNYELHYCQSGQTRLYSRLELYTALHQLIGQHPQILEFHKPGFSVMKFLQENGKLPNPLFDACPACKSEWAMDFTGTIYSCTATVGKPGEQLGTFYPQKTLQQDKVKQWQQRDVLNIEKCSQCAVQLVCGGGCGSIAANQHNNIMAPDCRPIAQLNALGFETYFRT